VSIGQANKNQSLRVTGAECVTVQFRDMDLEGDISTKTKVF